MGTMLIHTPHSRVVAQRKLWRNIAISVAVAVASVTLLLCTCSSGSGRSESPRLHGGSITRRLGGIGYTKKCTKCSTKGKVSSRYTSFTCANCKSNKTDYSTGTYAGSGCNHTSSDSSCNCRENDRRRRLIQQYERNFSK